MNNFTIIQTTYDNLNSYKSQIILKMSKLKDLHIKGTSKTPQIDLDAEKGILSLTGKSIPENASSFYEPVFKWAEQYAKNPARNTNLKLNVVYFNTASILWMGKFFKLLSRIPKAEHVLFIHLYFDIEEFDSMGEDDVKEALSPILDITSDATCSIGIKLYGVDDDGNIMKENIVLI